MSTTIQDLEERVNALNNSILQIQRNLDPVTYKAETALNKTPQIDENTANIDYVAMMTDVEIPTEV